MTHMLCVAHASHGADGVEGEFPSVGIPKHAGKQGSQAAESKLHWRPEGVPLRQVSQGKVTCSFAFFCFEAVSYVHFSQPPCCVWVEQHQQP